MNTNFLPRKQKPVALALAALLLATTAGAWASELSNLDSVRIQRIKLINGMLAHGAVTPEKADEMIREVNRRTAETKEALLSGTPIDTAAALQPSSSLATATAAPGVVVAAAATTAVVTDAMKSEMRDQIKRELAAEMKTQMADDIKRQVLAELTGATSGSAGMAIAQAGPRRGPTTVRCQGPNSQIRQSMLSITATSTSTEASPHSVHAGR